MIQAEISQQAREEQEEALLLIEAASVRALGRLRLKEAPGAASRWKVKTQWSERYLRAGLGATPTVCIRRLIVTMVTTRRRRRRTKRSLVKMLKMLARQRCGMIDYGTRGCQVPIALPCRDISVHDHVHQGATALMQAQEPCLHPPLKGPRPTDT